MTLRTCRTATVEWAMLGSSVQPSGQLLEHSAACETCAALIREVLDTRKLADLLPAKSMAQDRHEQMKFLLMANARQARAAEPRRSQSNAKVLKWSLAALVVASGVVAAASSLDSTRSLLFHRRPKSSSPAQPAARQIAVCGNSAAHSTSCPITTTAATPPVDAKNIAVPSSTSSTRTAAALVAPASTASSAAGLADSKFAEAWSMYRAGQYQAASAQFDRLLYQDHLDASRTADILYWSAQAHQQSGDSAVAQKRCETLLARYPGAPHATDAALLLGEAAVAGGRYDAARGYLNRALKSPHQVVRTRAERALAKLPTSNR